MPMTGRVLMDTFAGRTLYELWHYEYKHAGRNTTHNLTMASGFVLFGGSRCQVEV